LRVTAKRVTANQPAKIATVKAAQANPAARGEGAKRMRLVF